MTTKKRGKELGKVRGKHQKVNKEGWKDWTKQMQAAKPLQPLMIWQGHPSSLYLQPQRHPRVKPTARAATSSPLAVFPGWLFPALSQTPGGLEPESKSLGGLY